jgi:prepilin-type N-terminal cleavage/methylation domain-containing protein
VTKLRPIACSLEDERGFTLTEMLVTIMLMTVVLFAIYSVFDITVRAYSFGNNKVEATESARVGMEKMEREIRQAYKYNHAASQDHVFFTTTSPTTPLAVSTTTYTFPELTFGNELGSPGDGQITCPTSTSCEYITYKLTNADGTLDCTAAPCTLWRASGSKSGPVVENVALGGLSFKLLKSDGTAPTDESQVGMVLVKLNVVVDRGIDADGRQELTTVVDLRNR